MPTWPSTSSPGRPGPRQAARPGARRSRCRQRGLGARAAPRFREWLWRADTAGAGAHRAAGPREPRAVPADIPPRGARRRRRDRNRPEARRDLPVLPGRAHAPPSPAAARRRLGAVPICPVDHAARSTVALAGLEEPGCRVWHVFEDDVLRADEILRLVFELLRELNQPTSFTNCTSAAALLALGIHPPQLEHYVPRIWHGWLAHDAIDPSRARRHLLPGQARAAHRRDVGDRPARTRQADAAAQARWCSAAARTSSRKPCTACRRTPRARDDRRVRPHRPRTGGIASSGWASWVMSLRFPPVRAPPARYRDRRRSQRGTSRSTQCTRVVQPLAPGRRNRRSTLAAEAQSAPTARPRPPVARAAPPAMSRQKINSERHRTTPRSFC